MRKLEQSCKLPLTVIVLQQRLRRAQAVPPL